MAVADADYYRLTEKGEGFQAARLRSPRRTAKLVGLCGVRAWLYTACMAIPRFHLSHTALLVIDMQEKLVPVVREPQRLIESVGRMIDGATALGLPVLATEQYRKGLGDTITPIAGRLGGALCRAEKLKFSAFIGPVREILIEKQIRSVMVCGIESHVCVLQTCLDLVDSGYTAGLAIDAISSRHQTDHDAALLRMTQIGVIPTTVESVLFELTHEAGTDRFKRVLGVVK